jgi:hypothetical protein
MRTREQNSVSQSGTSFACLPGMLAAALIPLMFILGLVALFVMGAWPMSWLPGLAVLALLVGLAIGLARMLTHLDDHHTPH